MKNVFIDTTEFDAVLAPGYAPAALTVFKGYVRPGREFSFDVPSGIVGALGAERLHDFLNKRACQVAIALLLHYVEGRSQEAALAEAAEIAYSEGWLPKVEAIFAEYAARPIEDFPAPWQEHMRAAV